MLGLTGPIFAVSFFLTLLLQTVMGFSPLKTGLAFLPFADRHRGDIAGGRQTHDANPTPSVRHHRAPARGDRPLLALADSCQSTLRQRGARPTPRARARASASASSHSSSARPQGCNPPTWASHPRCSTPPSRLAEHSDSPSSSPSPTAATRSALHSGAAHLGAQRARTLDDHLDRARIQRRVRRRRGHGVRCISRRAGCDPQLRSPIAPS